MKRLSTRLATAGIAAGLVIGGASIASAGHLNPLLEADLSGRNEVASNAKSNKIVGDPNGRGEGYVFGIDNDDLGADGTVDNTDTLCYIVIVDGISELGSNPGNGRAAHIHRGAKGENGPVVANLAFPTDGQAADCLSENEVGKFTADAGPGIVQDILANPEGYYFNVHNNEYPGGAVRGQLEEQGHHHDH
ncbi:CHRD domain-containing protein [Actinospongicola halichondriae]|uniref:CHRD domain-containing protein n=1 Tax=Actinospongicola halichondriae TaxID=3236844 RepID=UPI003D386749